MSQNVVVSFAASTSGELSQNNLGPSTYTITNSPMEIYKTTLPGGTTLLLVPQVPVPATFVRIVPSSSGGNKWIMASAGDTVGFQIHPTIESWISMSPSQTSFIIKCSGSETVAFFWY